MPKGDKIAALVEDFRANPNGVKFKDLVKVCNFYFDDSRQDGTSHKVYKTPWPGNPRVNIQNFKGEAKPYQKGEAKPYQVRQVIKAIDKLVELMR